MTEEEKFSSEVIVAFFAVRDSGKVNMFLATGVACEMIKMGYMKEALTFATIDKDDYVKADTKKFGQLLKEVDEVLQVEGFLSQS